MLQECVGSHPGHISLVRDGAVLSREGTVGEAGVLAGPRDASDAASTVIHVTLDNVRNRA